MHRAIVALVRRPPLAERSYRILIDGLPLPEVGFPHEALVDGDARWLTIEFPASLAAFIVRKGSIAVDGISLTVADLRDRELDVMIIPFTWDHTSLSSIATGEQMNLECDMVGKYVARAVELTQRWPG